VKAGWTGLRPPCSFLQSIRRSEPDRAHSCTVVSQTPKALNEIRFQVGTTVQDYAVADVAALTFDDSTRLLQQEVQMPVADNVSQVRR